MMPVRQSGRGTAACDRGLSALGREGHERDVAGTLDGCAKLALVSSTITGDAAGDDFPALGDQVPQTFDIFIVDVRNLIRTETANFLTWETPFRRHPVIASYACATYCVIDHTDGRWTSLEGYVIIVH
jgi:hypothetical protein